MQIKKTITKTILITIAMLEFHASASGSADCCWMIKGGAESKPPRGCDPGTPQAPNCTGDCVVRTEATDEECVKGTKGAQTCEDVDPIKKWYKDTLGSCFGPILPGGGGAPQCECDAGTSIIGQGEFDATVVRKKLLDTCGGAASPIAMR